MSHPGGQHKQKPVATTGLLSASSNPLRRFRGDTGWMTPEPVAEVLDQLATFVNDSVASHGFACMGLRQITALFEVRTVLPENPDPDIFLGIGDPNTPEARTYAVWKRSEALIRVAISGPVEVMLGQQWVVYVFAAWEHGFRPRLAAAHGCEETALQYPLLGDLRHLRNDIVHHHGIATHANTGRCQVLTTWFSDGDPIALRPDHFAEFVHRFPLKEMHAHPAG